MPNPFVYLVPLMRISDNFSEYFMHFKRKQAKCAKKPPFCAFVDQKNGFPVNFILNYY
jgi:hypothetical protein